MSNIYQDAADAIRRAAKQYETFVAAAEVLDRAGSLDNAAKEAQRARDSAIKAKNKAEADLAVAVKAYEQTKADAKALLDVTNAQATAMRQQAEQDAAAIVNNARLKAQGEGAVIIEREQKTADIIADKANQAGAKLAKLLAEVEAAELALASKAKEQAEMVAAIEQLRARFGA